MGFYLSALNQSSEWNFRKVEQRLIVVKTKNEKVRKAAALDVLTKLSIALNIPENVSLENLQPEKQYLAQIKIYTSKNLEGIDEEFVEFFDALDVDQAVEDFIKAYWVYPSKIRFELVELEES